MAFRQTAPGWEDQPAPRPADALVTSRTVPCDARPVQGDSRPVPGDARESGCDRDESTAQGGELSLDLDVARYTASRGIELSDLVRTVSTEVWNALGGTGTLAVHGVDDLRAGTVRIYENPANLTDSGGDGERKATVDSAADSPVRLAVIDLSGLRTAAHGYVGTGAPAEVQVTIGAVDQRPIADEIYGGGQGIRIARRLAVEFRWANHGDTGTVLDTVDAISCDPKMGEPT